MAGDPKPRGLDPRLFQEDSQPVLDPTQEALSRLNPQIQEDIAALSEAFDRTNASEARLEFIDPQPLTGTIVFRRDEHNGKRLVITGDLGRDLPEQGVVVTYATVEGHFYRQVGPNNPVYANDGQHVDEKSLVGIVSPGKNQFRFLEAPVSGTIKFLAENAQQVFPAKEGEEHGTPLFHIRPTVN